MTSHETSLLVHLLILVCSFQWCVLLLCPAKLYRSCPIRDKCLIFTQKDVDLLKQQQWSNFTEPERTWDNIQKFVVDRRGKLTHLENPQSKRNNLRLNRWNTWEERRETSEQIVKQILREKQQLQIDVHVEQAHRVTRRSGDRRSGKPRTIVSRPRGWKEKEFILKSAEPQLTHPLAAVWITIGNLSKRGRRRQRRRQEKIISS